MASSKGSVFQLSACATSRSRGAVLSLAIAKSTACCRSSGFMPIDSGDLRSQSPGGGK